MKNKDSKGSWQFIIKLVARRPMTRTPQFSEDFFFRSQTYDGTLVGAKRKAHKMLKERCSERVTAYVYYQGVMISSKLYGEAMWFDNCMKHRFGF